MSLRTRLSLIIGLSFVMLWGLAAAWLICDVQKNVGRAFDERLIASARMIVSLVQRAPERLLNDESTAVVNFPPDLVLAETMACRVSTLEGRVVLRSHNAPSGMSDDLGEGFHNQTIRGIEWRSYTLNVGGLRFVIADRVDLRQSLKQSILTAAVVPVCFALFGSLLVLWIGVGTGLRPLHSIRVALSERNAQCLHPLQLGSLPSELKPLVDSQNDLLERIAQAMERERRFTGDAAHELRSPLTVIKTHIQVAKLAGGEYSSLALDKAEAGADRLQSILEQLLLLARVEGPLSFDDEKQVQADEIARQATIDSGCHDLIDLQCQDDVGHQRLAVPAGLAVTAIRNLLENAARHTLPGTRVDLQVRRDKDMTCFHIIDRGTGIKNPELHQIVKRFWHKGQHNGSGLGLAIVNAIVTRCHGELSFHNLENGFEAVVRFPSETS